MTGRILSGGKSNFEIIRKGLGEVFFERASKYSDNVFQIDALTGEKETFSSAKLRSIRLAISLRELGITPEDVVLTCLKITIDTVIPHLATLYLGAKFAGLDSTQTRSEWRHCLGLVQPRLIFVDEDQVEGIEKCLMALGMQSVLVVYGDSSVHPTFRDLARAKPDEELFVPKVIENCLDTAFILFSSGTTGLPKAITISHSSMLNSTQLFLEMYGTEYFTVELVFSTYYWMSSMKILTRCFFTGACRLLFTKFHAEETLKAIEKYKVSSCQIGPARAQHLLTVDNIQKYDLSSMKFYMSTGTCIHPEHMSGLRKMFRNGIILNVYGSTETCGSVTGYDTKRDLDYAQNNLYVSGKCMKDMKIKIIDEVSRQIACPYQPGEIWVQTPYGMSGYYNGSAPSNLDSDGFFQTGDIGYYDENDFIYISGRSNQMFKYGCLKVKPEFWEAILQNHPSIHEAGVFGIPHGSDGFLPAACIVLKEHASVTVEEIEEFFIQETSEGYKLDGGIRFVPEIPKTPSGKVKRRELFNVFTNGSC